MKNRYLKICFAVIAVGLLFVACGGGSGFTKNKILGIYPALFLDNARKIERLKQEKRDKMAASHTIEDVNATNSAYENEYNLLMSETSEAAGKAVKQLIGRDVPFEMLTAESTGTPLLDIVSVKITDVSVSTGEITVSVIVRTNYDMEGMPALKILYQFVDDEGESIFGWAINPFDRVNGRRDDTTGIEFKAGDVISEQGTPLMMYCGSYDFSRFSKIVFRLS